MKFSDYAVTFYNSSPEIVKTLSPVEAVYKAVNVKIGKGECFRVKQVKNLESDEKFTLKTCITLKKC